MKAPSLTPEVTPPTEAELSKAIDAVAQRLGALTARLTTATGGLKATLAQGITPDPEDS